MNGYSEIYLDCASDDFSDVPAVFREYCKNSVLTVKSADTIILLSLEEYEKLVEKIESTKNFAIRRFVFGNCGQVNSFEDLPEMLEGYAERFWGQRCTSFRLIYEDGIYVIRKPQ